MRETTQQDQAAQTQTAEHDVAAGTFYTLMLLGIILSVAAAPFTGGVSLTVTALCLVLVLTGRKAQDTKAQAEQAKGGTLNTAERAGGCGAFAVLVFLIGAGFLALLLSVGAGV